MLNNKTQNQIIRKNVNILDNSDLTPEIRVGFETLVEDIRLLRHLARCKRRQGLGRRKSFTAGGPFTGTQARDFFPNLISRTIFFWTK
jgi:hypothetical protein